MEFWEAKKPLLCCKRIRSKFRSTVRCALFTIVFRSIRMNRNHEIWFRVPPCHGCYSSEYSDIFTWTGHRIWISNVNTIEPEWPKYFWPTQRDSRTSNVAQTLFFCYFFYLNHIRVAEKEVTENFNGFQYVVWISGGSDGKPAMFMQSL